MTWAKWALLRLLLSTAGRLGRGIRVGYRHGFDSGTMLDYVYTNHPQGWLGIGRLVDRVFLDAVGWRAIRARRELLTEVLRAEVERRGGTEPGRPVRILDVAAGPGRYLQDLAAEYPRRTRILCRDLATDGLRRGRRQATERGLTNVHYEEGDALDPAPTTPLRGAPDVVVVSGLYELILDERIIAASIARLRDLLAPGGTLVFTVQERHPQLDLIANVLPNRDGQAWVMECREATQAERWATQAGCVDVASRGEPVGLFAVVTATA